MYHCEICDYSTKLKFDWERHIVRKSHLHFASYMTKVIKQKEQEHKAEMEKILALSSYECALCLCDWLPSEGGYSRWTCQECQVSSLTNVDSPITVKMKLKTNGVIYKNGENNGEQEILPSTQGGDQKEQSNIL